MRVAHNGVGIVAPQANQCEIDEIAIDQHMWDPHIEVDNLMLAQAGSNTEEIHNPTNN